MELYSLKVKRSKAGHVFPFDRVYLVTHQNRHYLKRLFRYALVMPVEGYLKMTLCASPPEEYINRTFNRDDAEAEPGVLKEDEWTALLDSEQWVMAVPLLTRWAKKNTPKYLVAKGWYNRRDVRKKAKVTTVMNPSPFPSLTYLQTPEKAIRPVCVLCPRFVLHQNGECHVGQPVCFESLPLGIHNYFKEGLDAPAPSPNVKEPEVQGVVDELVSENQLGAYRVPRAAEYENP